VSEAANPALRAGTPAGRWVLAAAVLGSSVAFLDGTVVNVALPTIADDLGASLTQLQWVVDAYLVTLTALLLLGGAFGDKYGRKRVFVTGLVAFTAASVLCGVAPNIEALIVARGLQGIGGALLVPGSLALLSASFREEDRGGAIGAWSGLSGVSSAIGPFVGGWLIDSASWRLIFLINVPLAGVTMWITVRYVPETRDESAVGAPDIAGAALVSIGLAALAYALIEGPNGVGSAELGAAILGVVCLVAFLLRESRIEDPMLPLTLFRSRQFSGANGTTLAVYAALGAALFFIVIHLQQVLDYSALEAGLALMPVTLLMLVLSSRAGALAQRIGPTLPMTLGPLVCAVGFLLFARIEPGAGYVSTVLPAATVFGLGLSLTVAPLTVAVLAAVDEHRIGIASGVNNAAARFAGLLAVAVIPGVVGLSDAVGPAARTDAFVDAMHLSAALCAAGGLISLLTVRKARAVVPTTQASILQPCHDPARSMAAG
jgi:EmrB/QacA subfamily drug resistance transporter